MSKKTTTKVTIGPDPELRAMQQIRKAIEHTDAIDHEGRKRVLAWANSRYATRTGPEERELADAIKAFADPAGTCTNLLKQLVESYEAENRIGMGNALSGMAVAMKDAQIRLLRAGKALGYVGGDDE